MFGIDIALVSDKTPVEYKDEGFNIVQDKIMLWTFGCYGLFFISDSPFFSFYLVLIQQLMQCCLFQLFGYIQSKLIHFLISSANFV